MAKKKKKGLFKKVGSGLKKAAKKVGQFAKKAAGTVAFAPIIPLIPAMKILLNKKGIKSGGVQDTAKKFFDMIRSRDYENEDFYDYIGYCDTDDLENFSYDRRIDILARRQEEKNFSENYDEENIDPVTVTAIVTAIVKFFKAKKKAKDSGQQLDPAEQQAIDSMEQAAAVMTAPQFTTETDAGKMAAVGFLKSNWLILAAALLVLILIIRK